MKREYMYLICQFDHQLLCPHLLLCRLPLQIPLQTNACTCMHVNYMIASMHQTLCFTYF